MTFFFKRISNKKRIIQSETIDVEPVEVTAQLFPINYNTANCEGLRTPIGNGPGDMVDFGPLTETFPTFIAPLFLYLSDPSMTNVNFLLRLYSFYIHKLLFKKTF